MIGAKIYEIRDYGCLISVFENTVSWTVLGNAETGMGQPQTRIPFIFAPIIWDFPVNTCKKFQHSKPKTVQDNAFSKNWDGTTLVSYFSNNHAPSSYIHMYKISDPRQKILNIYDVF